MLSQKYLLYGFGISLESVARYLFKKQIPFCISDDSTVQLDKAKNLGYQVIHPNEIPDQTFTDLVVAPGIPPNHPIFKYGLPCWNDISLFFELHKGKLPKTIGVTGTFGKSTTVSLIKHIYDQVIGPIQLGGNIGIPIFDCDPSLPIVIELSAQQLELCDIPLDIGVILNVYPQHLDRYASFAEYHNTKLKIFNRAKIKIGNVVLKYDGQLQTISDSDPADFYLDTDLFENFKLVSSVKTPISHISVLGAFSVLRNLNIQPLDILKGLEDFPPLEHRCEVVIDKPDTLQDILCVNDSKSTNLANSVYCLKKFSGGKIGWICGGKFAEQDLSILEHMPPIHYIGTIGSSGMILYEYFKNHRTVGFLVTLEAAMRACLLNGCTTLIFSPGYSSFDQYRNFIERGNHFKELLKRFNVHNY